MTYLSHCLIKLLLLTDTETKVQKKNLSSAKAKKFWEYHRGKRSFSERREFFAPFCSQRRVIMLKGCKVIAFWCAPYPTDPQFPRKSKHLVILILENSERKKGQYKGDQWLIRQLFDTKACRFLWFNSKF